MNQLPTVLFFVFVEIIQNLFAGKSVALEVLADGKRVERLTASIEEPPQTLSTAAADLDLSKTVPVKNETALQSSTGNVSTEAQPFSSERNPEQMPQTLSFETQSLNEESSTLQAQSSDPPEQDQEPERIPVEFVFPDESESLRFIPQPLPTPSQVLLENPDPEMIRFSAAASESILKANAQYKRIPQIVEKEQLPPFFTVFPLNGALVSHLTQGQLSLGYEFGNGISQNFLVNGLYAISSQIKQSISQDNVFVSEQTGAYLQLQTVEDHRTVSVTRIDPQTVNGLQFQLSFTGSCAAAGRFGLTDPSAQCSLTPALVTDRSSVDRSTLQATNIFQLGSFGDVVSPESLVILAQPGFQGVGANGQRVGLDLLFPNTGTLDGNSQSTQSNLNRFENLRDTYTFGLYRLKQVYKSNFEKAVLARTVYGLTGILFDPSFSVNAAIQGVAQLLPALNPTLKGDANQPAVTGLNQSLIFSANNTRLPERSFVIYQVGYGETSHPKQGQKKESGAMFNSLWLGLSPVAERTFSTSSFYLQTSPPSITNFAGAEGGSGGLGAPPSVLALANLGDTVNSILSSDLSSFYTQAYFTFFQTNVNRVTRSELFERVSYIPHLSLTGNITEPDSVLRYYSGVILSSAPKAYLGVDYARDLQRDLRLSTSIIGYLNPTRDYYSKAEGRLEKTFRLSRSSSFSLFGSLRYVFDQIDDSGRGLYFNPVDNFLSVGITGHLGPFSAGVTQFLDLLPSSVPSRIGFALSADLGENGSLSGYLIPQRGVTNYGILARFKLNSAPNAPSLSLSWGRAVFDFGTDSFNNALKAREDKFQILFEFGAPANPFVQRGEAVASRQTVR